MNEFGTTITCMDGRVQEEVNLYVKKNYNVKYVDTITLAGPVKVSALQKQKSLLHNLQFRSDISVHGHKSKVIAVVGHHDCLGIVEDDETQKQFIKDSVRSIKEWYEGITVIGLWLDEEFKITKLND